jgi:hypothetical protein
MHRGRGPTHHKAPQGGGARSALLGSAVAALLALGAIAAPTASAAIPQCTLYADPAAAPGGSGQPTSPFNTFQALARALGPGETGCLAAGATFHDNIDLSGKSGSPGNPIRIMSQDPLHPATLEGVPDSPLPRTLYFGTDTNYYEIAGINIRGHKSAMNSPAVVVNGTGNRLVGNDITHDLTTCVLVGQQPSQRAKATVLDGNAVHTCGAAGSKSNGIGVSNADGTVIENGYVYAVPAHGIELYPDADGTTIANNVIDGQGNGMGDGYGVQFAGGPSSASDNNVVARNIISNNQTKNIGFFWEGPVGTGNVVRENCVYSTNPNGNYQRDPPVGGATTGYTVEPNNVEDVDPQFQNRPAPPAGFALSASSPCIGKGPLPASDTGAAQAIVDPEAANVFSATIAGDVNGRFQPATYKFQFGTGDSLADVPGGSLVAAPLAQPVFATVTNLAPSTTYQYRVVGANNSGATTGATASLTTPSEPQIAPLPLTITYGFAFDRKRKSQVLSNIRVGELPRGATAVFTCTGSSRCPSTKPRPFGDIKKLLEGRPLGDGTQLRFSVTGQPVGRYIGRAVILTVRHGGRTLHRKDGCIDGINEDLVPCLSFSRVVNPAPRKPLVKSLQLTSIPTGATVSVTCKGKGCPRFAACRIVEGQARSRLVLVRTQAPRRVRVGNAITVRVQKPLTRGLFVRLSFKRGTKTALKVEQKVGFGSSKDKIPTSCAGA